MIACKGGWVVVAWESPDEDERGRQIIPGSEAGLCYGREVHVPVARVLDVGPLVRGVKVSDRIIATKDLGALIEVVHLEVQGIATLELDPRTDRTRPTDAIAAVLTDDGPRAIGRRIIGEPVESAAASDIIQGVTLSDGCERVRVTSVGEEVYEVSPGDVVLVPHQSHGRYAWADAGREWVSVVSVAVVGTACFVRQKA